MISRGKLMVEMCKAQETRGKASTSSNTILEEKRDDFSDSGDSEYIPNNISTSSDSYEANKENKRTRWAQKKPEQNKRNKNKNKRRDGFSYINSKDKVLPAKLPRPVCCSKCQFKCSSKINEESRHAICRQYWKMDYMCQKSFLLQLVSENAPKRRRTESTTIKRKYSRSYYFYNENVKQRVCKTFFLATLCISHGPVDSALSGRSDFGCFVNADKRGKCPPKNKTPDEIMQRVREHIESFPTMPSHYCRKTTQRKYLDSNLSIQKMYELYEEFCKKESTVPVSLITYKRCFGKNYNLSFYKPKKDLCLTCENYKKKQENENEYLQHIQRKNEAYEAKAKDKLRCSVENSFISATFDLQSVLQIPCSDVSLMYYSRKLCAYNLTIYEAMKPNNTHCFIWTEINGQRGSCEIGTALYKWILNLPENVTEISLFSDSCGGQNRNQFIASFFLFIVQSTNVKILQHNFMESGHSYMEVDSVHSAIESAKKYVPVYTLYDWINIIKLARSSRKNKTNIPYQVTELLYSDMLNLKTLSQKILKNRNINTEGQKVQWLKIKCLRYEKEKPNSILYKYNYSDNEFKVINIGNRKAISTRSDQTPLTLTKLYDNALPISNIKKKDLITLCNKGVVPEIFHPWYKSLPVEEKEDFVYDDSEEEESS